MAIPLVHPSSLSSCHGFSASVLNDGSSRAFRIPLQDAATCPPRSSTSDNMDTKRPWVEGCFKEIYQWDERNKNTNAMIFDPAPGIATSLPPFDVDNGIDGLEYSNLIGSVSEKEEDLVESWFMPDSTIPQMDVSLTETGFKSLRSLGKQESGLIASPNQQRMVASTQRGQTPPSKDERKPALDELQMAASKEQRQTMSSEECRQTLATNQHRRPALTGLRKGASMEWRQFLGSKEQRRPASKELPMIALLEKPPLSVKEWDSLEVEDALRSLGYGVETAPVEAFFSILQKCRRKKHLGNTRQLLLHIYGNGLECHIDVGNNLVATLIECGSMSFALQVFHKLGIRTEYSWTYVIRGFTELGDPDRAAYAFLKMKEDNVEPSKFTFVAILKACARVRSLAKGEEVLLEIVKLGLESDYFIGNTMVDLYAKCGALIEAEKIFSRLSVQDAVSWTALISGYMGKGLSKEALTCFEKMQVEDILPDAVTYIGVLKACCSIGDIDRGQKLHAQIAIEEFEEDPFIGNALVDMYIKFGLLEEAEDVFADLSTQDVVSWTALIAGFTEQGENEKAVTSYWQMQEQGSLPNSMTFASVLKACGNKSDEATGQWIHSLVHAVAGWEPLEIITATALIDMYAKCGNVISAQNVFDIMSKRDLVGWNTLITGYTRQGKTEIILELFERMMDEGICPDQVTFLCVLTACSRAGLVQKGCLYFYALTNGYGIAPTIKHYNCMIDLLGRAGQLKEALTMLRSMPFPPDLVAWTTLLAVCRKWGNVEMGQQAFESAMRLDENHIAAYNAMFNLYVDGNMWDEAKKIEAMKLNLVARKQHTKSCIEIGGSVHAFVGGDAKDPQFHDLYAKLEHIRANLRDERFMPAFSHVLHDAGHSATEDEHCGYTEVIALVYGLINTPERTPLHVVKNARVCDKCHVIMALVSKETNRALSCRDTCQVHSFREGKCCCED